MSLAERRRPSFDSELLVRTGLVWLCVCLFAIAVKWSAISAMALPDADDTLRLVRLRELVAGQGWFDLIEHRIDPAGGGVLMHWSRLVDLPLLGVYHLFALVLSPALAERVTLVLVPLLTMGIALLLAARIAWRLIDPRLITYVGFLMAVTIPLFAQLGPLRIDHHGWQIVAVLAALNALMARSEAKGAWAMGIALGLGLAVSLELLPVAALFAGLLALRWLRAPRQRIWLAKFLPALVLTGSVSLLATHGTADLVNHCDSLSPAYLVALAVAAVGVSALAAQGRITGPALLAGLGLVALLAGGALILQAPACARGPFPMLDPLVQRMWYTNVTEGMPIWRLPFTGATVLMWPPLLGLYAAFKLAGRSHGWLREYWIDHALILAGLTVMALLVSRMGALACAVALPPVAWQLREWQRAAGRQRRPLRRVAALFVVSMAALPMIPLAAARQVLPARSAAKPVDLAKVQQTCDISAAAPALHQLPRATIFAPLDLGPVVLAHSRHDVVASAHHRGAAAMHDVYAAFLASPEAAQARVRARGGDYVLICPAMPETGNLRRAAPGGLMDRLAAGAAPSWLEPVALPADSGFKLWKVRSTSN